MKLKSVIKNLHQKIFPPIYFISYPKAGRTWLRLLIAEVFFKELPIDKRVELTPLTQFKPFVKTVIFGHWGYSELEEISIAEKFPGKKNFVMLVRDPRDIVVSSFYEHTRRIGGYEGPHDISVFIRNEKFGIHQIINFYNLYYEKYANRIYTIIRYEDMHADTKGVLEQVLKKISRRKFSETELLKAVENCKLDKLKREAMRSNNDRLKPYNKSDETSHKFRKGKIGDYRDVFNSKDRAFLDLAVKNLNKIYGY